MKKSILNKYWWLPLLAFFDFIYYYFIQHLTTPQTEGLWVSIRWEGVFFVFIISLLSLACSRWVKGRVEKIDTISIPVKYLQILLYSFIAFIVITAVSQFILEYAAGQQRKLEYIIGNGLIYIFLHIVVGNAYIAFEYFKESSTLKQNLILSQKAKTETELRILQQQMSPHFLFNNLNTLASLIPNDEKKAVKFTHNLSNTFRYLSQNSKNSLTTFKEELDFLKNYMELLHIRFGNAYILDQQLENIDTQNLLIVPLALQVIIENVVKHNSGSRSNPLKIEISTKDNSFLVKNEIRQKANAQIQESGIGLNNLQERYRLSTNRAINFGAINGFFIVELPLIKRIDDESFNY